MFFDFDLVFTRAQFLPTLLAIGILVYFASVAYRRRGDGTIGVRTVPQKSVGRKLYDLWSSTPLWMVSLWFLVPLVLPFVLQYFIGPSFEPRYTISALPAFALLCALIVYSVPLRKLIPPAALLIAFVLVWLPSMWHYYTWDILEQWSEVADHVSTQANESDKLMFLGNGARSDGNNHLRDAYQMYADKAPILCADGVYDLSAEAENREMGQCLQEGHRVWLVMRYHKIADVDWMQKQVEQHYRGQIVKQQEFTNIRLLLVANHAQSMAQTRRTN